MFTPSSRFDSRSCCATRRAGPVGSSYSHRWQKRLEWLRCGCRGVAVDRPVAPSVEACAAPAESQDASGWPGCQAHIEGSEDLTPPRPSFCEQTFRRPSKSACSAPPIRKAVKDVGDGVGPGGTDHSGAPAQEVVAEVDVLCAVGVGAGEQASRRYGLSYAKLMTWPERLVNAVRLALASKAYCSVSLLDEVLAVVLSG
jgi:hypothetical protein